MHREDNDLLSAAQLDFERYFGRSEHTTSKFDLLAGEQVIVVENHVKRAFYSCNIELIKVINLTGEE